MPAVVSNPGLLRRNSRKSVETYSVVVFFIIVLSKVVHHICIYIEREAKETYYRGKRDLLLKETDYRGTRDLRDCCLDYTAAHTAQNLLFLSKKKKYLGYTGGHTAEHLLVRRSTHLSCHRLPSLNSPKNSLTAADSGA